MAILDYDFCKKFFMSFRYEEFLYLDLIREYRHNSFNLCYVCQDEVKFLEDTNKIDSPSYNIACDVYDLVMFMHRVILDECIRIGIN